MKRKIKKNEGIQFRDFCFIFEGFIVSYYEATLPVSNRVPTSPGSSGVQ